MRLKRYRAAGMTEAMAELRADLGPDALILDTRRVAGGVEVTAALDAPEPAPPAPPPLPVPPWIRARPVVQQPAIDPSGLLHWHGVPPRLARRLGQGPLVQALATTLHFAPLQLAPRAPPILLVGPPGAGKTLTVARLATRLVLAGGMPLAVTADGQRAGATAQLLAYTRLLGIRLVVAEGPEMLRRALARPDCGAPMLIDTPGLDPFEPAQRAALAELIAAASGVVALVLPAGLDPAEASELAVAHAGLGATHLIATRLDAARRLGGVLAAADAAGLALAEAGIGHAAQDGLVVMTPELLAERLVAAAPQGECA